MFAGESTQNSKSLLYFSKFFVNANFELVTNCIFKKRALKHESTDIYWVGQKWGPLHLKTHIVFKMPELIFMILAHFNIVLF